MHTDPAPAPLVLEELGRLRDAAGAAPVLDAACGAGRNAIATARAGLTTLAIDRDAVALAELRSRGAGLPLTAIRSDLETGHGIPLRERSCGGILVFRFLFRPLADAIARALRPGGLLIYETFTTGQLELKGGPRNPAFLLEAGELPTLFPTLRVLRFEEGVFAQPGPQALARLVAIRDE